MKKFFLLFGVLLAALSIMGFAVGEYGESIQSLALAVLLVIESERHQ